MSVFKRRTKITSTRVTPLGTVHGLSNGDVIHVHDGGDVWRYTGGDLSTATYFVTVDEALGAT